MVSLVSQEEKNIKVVIESLVGQEHAELTPYSLQEIHNLRPHTSENKSQKTKRIFAR